ncbi:hypothetical protein [Amycolatopsis sp. NPDC004378]
MPKNLKLTLPVAAAMAGGASLLLMGGVAHADPGPYSWKSGSSAYVYFYAKDSSAQSIYEADRQADEQGKRQAVDQANANANEECLSRGWASWKQEAGYAPTYTGPVRYKAGPDNSGSVKVTVTWAASVYGQCI